MHFQCRSDFLLPWMWIFKRLPWAPRAPRAQPEPINQKLLNCIIHGLMLVLSRTTVKPNGLIGANPSSTTRTKTSLLPYSPHDTNREHLNDKQSPMDYAGLSAASWSSPDLLTNLLHVANLEAPNATKSCPTLDIASILMGSVSRHFIVPYPA